jgi:NNP family nitrate/nitrite transporter-like MFS transporter
MKLSDFRKAGHWPSLFSAFLYFDFSFMVWVMLGALGAFIAKDLQLNPSQKGFLVALPLLGGAAFRLLLGSVVDQIGPKKTGLLGLTLTLIPLVLAWKAPQSYGLFLLVGLLLGIAGASFVAALPLAGRWYPPQWQGLALGIAGAGNSGTVLAAFFAPRLAQNLGWQSVFGLALLPWLAVLAVFSLMAKEPPLPPKQNASVVWKQVLSEKDSWWFSLLYAVTFGGFVGLASFLPIFFTDQYAMTKLAAANLVTLCVLMGSALRPVGGYLADRFGARMVLSWVYGGVVVFSLGAGMLLPQALEGACLALLLGTLGLGNGAVFKMVPHRFSRQLGTVTGMLGAAGGLGGFFLPVALGGLKQATGSFAWGFVVWAAAGLVAQQAVRFNPGWQGQAAPVALGAKEAAR